MVVHHREPVRQLAGGAQQEAAGPVLADFHRGMERLPGAAEESAALHRGNGGVARLVQQEAHFPQHRAWLKSGEDGFGSAGAGLHLGFAGYQQVHVAAGIALAEERLPRRHRNALHRREAGVQLLRAEPFEAAETLKRVRGNGVRHAEASYTPRSTVAFATRPNATIKAAVRQGTFLLLTRSRMVA